MLDELCVDAIYPKHDTPACQRDSLAQQRSDITIGFLKSMNTDTGTRIGQTNNLSIVEKKVKGELEEDSWEDDNAKDFAQNMYAEYAEFAKSRRKAVEVVAGPV